MDFFPTSMAMQQILYSGKHLLIPRFQREYCWDKRIVREFFTDIVSRLIFEDHSTEAESDEPSIKNLPYFIGTMLFLGKFSSKNDSKSGSHDTESLEIVDGQQRITTITIFLSALSARLKSQAPGLAKKAFEYIQRTDDDDNPFSVLLTKTSYPFFQNYVQTPIDQRVATYLEPQTEEDVSIKSAYDKFATLMEGDNLKRQVASICGLKDGVLDSYSDIKILAAIRRELLEETQAVVITTSDRAAANMIFEILNGKGMHLANIDLIKNRLFEMIPDDGAADNAEEMWKKIQHNLNDRGDDIGLATFYRHFWISKYKKVTSSHLYDSFKISIKPHTKERYIQFLDEMDKESESYSMIVHPRMEDFQNRKEYAPVVQSMRILADWFSVDQSRIGLLALFNAKKQNLISFKQLSRCIRTIEIFHFAYNSVCRLPSNRFESLYSQFAIALRNADNKTEVNRILFDFLEKLSDLLPTENVFSENYYDITYFGKQKRQMNMTAKYAVNAIAMHKDDREQFEDDLSIEHIVPESSPSSRVTNIGNLIALESDLNRKAGDLSSKDKINVYSKSRYRWVSDFCDDYINFQESDIPVRAKRMAKYTYEKIIQPVMPQK